MRTLPTLLLLLLLLACAASFSLHGEPPPRTNAVLPPSPAPHPVSGPEKPPVVINAHAKSPRQAALQRALEDGDVCATQELLNGITAPEFYGALIAAIDGSPRLWQIFGPGGPALAAVPRPSSALRTKDVLEETVWAIRIGGMGISHDDPSRPNAAESSELLLDLERKDPGNAFYPFFRLLQEKRLGYSVERLRATAEKAARGSSFNSHLEDLFAEMDAAAWRNPALYAAVHGFSAARVPFPYFGVLPILRKIEKGTSFSGTPEIAALLAEELERGGRAAPNLHFDSLRFEAAHDLAPERYASLDDISRERGWSTQVFPFLPRREGRNAPCDPVAIEKAFVEARDTR